jgi:sugar/nucleoside kinase (ribokinase family)
MPSTPEFIAIGHVTRDLQSDGSSRIGGTVTFATLCAYQLGLAAGVVTCADAELRSSLSLYLPHISLQVSPSTHTTTFANIYQDGFRTQYLHARGSSLHINNVPSAWMPSPIVLFGPLAQEIDTSFVLSFPRQTGGLLAATPQGWLRRWDADGRIWPTMWQDAERVLPTLDVLILSHDDLLPFVGQNRLEADALLQRWSMLVPLLVATDGRHGATLFQHGASELFPAFPAQEVDPTGAGDVFAAAFLTHFYRYHNPMQAVIFANCTASFSIEHPGTTGIPSLQQVEQRLKSFHL